MAGFPKVVIHGDDDRTWPVASAGVLFEAATPPRFLTIVPGAGHIDVPFHDPAAYDAALAEVSPVR